MAAFDSSSFVHSGFRIRGVLGGAKMASVALQRVWMPSALRVVESLTSHQRSLLNVQVLQHARMGALIRLTASAIASSVSQDPTAAHATAPARGATLPEQHMFRMTSSASVAVKPVTTRRRARSVSLG